MSRSVRLATLATFLGVTACGGVQAPSEDTIYHDPALRPGVVPASTAAERELLTRLGQRPDAHDLEVDGARFVIEPAYHSASGRPCRRVREASGSLRLACELDAEWVFVPDVFEADLGAAE